MRESNFQSEIRLRVNPMLFVCRNPLQAQKMNAHPECTQVWCTSQYGERYFVHILKDMHGFPRDSSEIDVVALQKMDAANLHGGRRSWINEAADSQKKYARDRELARDRGIEDWLRPGGEGYERIKWATGNHLVVPVRQDVSKILHGRKGKPR